MQPAYLNRTTDLNRHAADRRVLGRIDALRPSFHNREIEIGTEFGDVLLSSMRTRITTKLHVGQMVWLSLWPETPQIDAMTPAGNA